VGDLKFSVISCELESNFELLERFTFFILSAVLLIHCLAALILGAGVEERFDCLIIQNLQTMLSIGKSMDWTVEDNIFNGLLFCVTRTSGKRGHTPFV